MRFLKGHMGGNTILLLFEEDFGNEGDPLERVLYFCSPEVLACHEAGILGKSSRKGTLKVRIAARTSRAYISACGGLTQVLGQALASTDLGEHYGLKIPENGSSEILLDTEGGSVPLHIEKKGNNVTTWTCMDSFVREIGNSGIEAMEIQGIPLLRVGKFLILRGEDLEEALPEANVSALDHTTRRIIEKVQREFLALRPQASKDLGIYDRKGNKDSSFRVLFPHWLPENHIEPACGTGTVAIGMAILHYSPDLLPANGENLELFMESGGSPILGGPDRSSLKFFLKQGIVQKAKFSHSFVELTARGEIIEGGDRAFSIRNRF